MKSGYYME